MPAWQTTRPTTGQTTTSYALLGLLSVRPWTTYELAKQVRRSLNWFWPRAERRLYDEPRGLVRHGLATASVEQTGRRPRTVYRITAKGRAALREWLDKPPAPPSTEFEGMIKIFFADAGTLPQLARNLDEIEAAARQRMATLAAWAAEQPRPFPQRAHLSAITLRLHFEQEHTVLRWVAWARDQIAQWENTADPGSWNFQRVLDELSDDSAAESSSP